MPNSPDPVLKHSRREAIVALTIWLCAMLYTVSYCSLFGYNLDQHEIQFVLGIPSWALWGIVLPWTLCLVASAWFAFGFMTDDSLE
jgi:hypothetical protein